MTFQWLFWKETKRISDFIKCRKVLNQYTTLRTEYWTKLWSSTCHVLICLQELQLQVSHTQELDLFTKVFLCATGWFLFTIFFSDSTKKLHLLVFVTVMCWHFLLELNKTFFFLCYFFFLSKLFLSWSYAVAKVTIRSSWLNCNLQYFKVRLLGSVFYCKRIKSCRYMDFNLRGFLTIVGMLQGSWNLYNLPLKLRGVFY